MDSMDTILGLFLENVLIYRIVSYTSSARGKINVPSRFPSFRCLQGASSPDPTTVYCDLRALRNDRVTLTERGAPHSLALMESGKLLPGVNVIIANPGRMHKCRESFGFSL